MFSVFIGGFKGLTMSQALRMIDANANRAREALRVLEDFARFGLNDSGISGELKGIRHALAGAVPAEAILHRDTEGDVGTAVKTSAELAREDLAHVITANGKRLTEALRSLEEYLKIDHPAAAAEIERARYRAYAVEQRIARTLRPAQGRLAGARLYVLITESACKGDWLATAERALEGGADILQLREKEMESGELLRRARALRGLCSRHGALLIINDRPDIALLSDADGVHVGQTDLPAVEVRKLIGSRMILGVSTHKLEDATRARLDGADYIGAGPVYRSPTKPREISPGLAYLRELREFPLPVFAIAGITVERVGEVVATGVTRVAVTAAVTGAEDVGGACREIKAALGSGEAIESGS
jgi:thiamine-phosphate pyrophosphorylase